MPLRQDGDYWYGDGPEDVWDYFVLYHGTTDPVGNWKQAVCGCGSTCFNILLDRDGEDAERICMVCGHLHRILDDPHMLRSSGDPQLDEELRMAETESVSSECLCICELDEFEVVGVTSPIPGKPVSANWFYLGLRCVACGCLGCYAEWHERHDDHEQLLALL